MPDTHEIVAIIPAKSVSKRLPGKNLVLFRGLPLFVWSVLYARAEGVQPVVLTDSELTAHIAKGFGALVYPQKPEQFDNYDAIPPVLEELQVQKIALLQATSPLRKRGVLDKMLNMVPSTCPSCFTSKRVKLQGKQGGKWLHAIQDVGESTGFDASDGNIIVCTSDYFREHNNYFLGDESVPVPNVMPYTLDIDTWDDFYAVELLAVAKPELLVHPIDKIAVVQNQRILKRDYSAFIDSCDLVVRMGTMDNLDSGRTGKRCDIHFSICWNHSYIPLDHPDDRHVDEANAAAISFQHKRDDWKRLQYKYSFGYTECYRGWGKHDTVARNFTTSALSIWHMHYTFPEATIYNLGTHDPHVHDDWEKVKMHGLYKHLAGDEKEILDAWAKQGIVVDILEEGKTEEEGEYSTLPKDDKPLPELILLRSFSWQAPYYIYTDKERIVTKAEAGYRMRYATIEEYEPHDHLIVLEYGNPEVRLSFFYNKELDSYDIEHRDTNLNIIVVKHRAWTGQLFIYPHQMVGYRGTNMGCDNFTVISYTPLEKLTVKWDLHGTTESFAYNPETGWRQV